MLSSYQFSRTQRTKRQTIDFKNFITSKPRAIQEECLTNGVWSPPCFSRICCNMAKTAFRALRVNEKLDIPADQPVTPNQYSLRGEKNIQLYTDGSMKNDLMGSAGLYLEDGITIYEFKTRPPSTQNASAKRAELYAILEGHEKCEDTIVLRLFTDCMTAIKNHSKLRLIITHLLLTHRQCQTEP
jgi:hypothetical protein